MNVKNILCPIDFSAQSEQAMAYASQIARESQAKLHLVHVYEPPLVYSDPHDGFIPPADLRPQMELLEGIHPPDPPPPFQREFMVGSASEALLEYAATHQIDLIVMGTHGRTGLSRLLMGSVAEAVARRATCPVLTMRIAQSGQEPLPGKPATEIKS